MVMARSRTFLASWIFALLVAGMVSISAEAAEPARYTFTIIATSAGALAGPGGPPTINKNGKVALWASLDDGGAGIFVGDGGALTTIAQTGSAFADIYPQSPSINKSGQVAFIADLAGGGRAIVTGKDGAATPLYDPTGPFTTFYGDAWISDAGRVAFHAQTDAGQFGIFTGTGGPATPIVVDGPANITGFPSVNRFGTVSFVAANIGGVTGVFIGNGSRITNLAETNGPYSPFGSHTGINDSGVVVALAFFDAGGSAIVTFGTSSITIVSTTDGLFSHLGSAAINNHGQVVFYGELPSGEKGIFTGPNPATDVVIKTGDSLLGSTVAGIVMSYAALNDSGQIAILAGLADGSLAVIRADPVPPKGKGR